MSFFEGFDIESVTGIPNAKKQARAGNRASEGLIPKQDRRGRPFGKKQRPVVKRKDVFDPTHIIQGMADKELTKAQFRTLGKARALPPDAQAFFDSRGKDF